MLPQVPEPVAADMGYKRYSRSWTVRLCVSTQIERQHYICLLSVVCMGRVVGFVALWACKLAGRIVVAVVVVGAAAGTDLQWRCLNWE